RALNALRTGDVDLDERDVRLVFGPAGLGPKFFRRCLARLFVTRREKDPETFAYQLPDNLEADSLVRAGNQRDPFCSRHEGTLTTDYTDENGSKEVLFGDGRRTDQKARAQTDHPHLSPLPSKGEEEEHGRHSMFRLNVTAADAN